jgi:hypothetical protein
MIILASSNDFEKRLVNIWKIKEKEYMNWCAHEMGRVRIK